MPLAAGGVPVRTAVRVPPAQMDIADLIVPQLPQQIELRVDFRVAVEQESGWYTKVGCDCADVLYRGVNDLCGSQLLHLSGRDRHPCFRDVRFPPKSGRGLCGLRVRVE